MRWPALLLSALLLGCHGSSSSPADPGDPGGPGDPGSPGDPGQVACALDADGAPWLAFASRRTGDYEIWSARADGTCLAQLTHDAAADLFPSWVGSTIAFASERGGAQRLWMHDLDTGDEGPLDTGDLEGATSPALSPDGTRLAFEGRAAGASRAEVYTVPAAGGTPVALETSPAGGAGPTWAPDGLTVYFVSTRSGSYDVWAAPATGGDAARVTTGSRIVGRPTVTPDGASLVYARTVAGASTTEVVRHRIATGAIDVVSSLDDSEPSVSSDGGRVALRSFRGGHADVVVEDLDGSGAFLLTSDDPSDGAPAFARMP